MDRDEEKSTLPAGFELRTFGSFAIIELPTL